MATLAEDLRFVQMDAPIVGSEEETELAKKCIKRTVKSRRDQRTIQQALGLLPYPWEGKNSKHNKYGTKRSQ